MSQHGGNGAEVEQAAIDIGLSWAISVRALEAINATLKRCHDMGGFVYYGSDMGVLAAAILTDLEEHGLYVGVLDSGRSAP